MQTDQLKPGRRARRHQATQHEILDTARRQIAEAGAAALSLRAIARAMELTAPAIYRYFASRDELVTALIVAAYTSLADALAAGRDARAHDTPANRLLGLMLAYREWALAHPQDYALIFGTPIPGYAPPPGATEPAAARAMLVLAEGIAAALEASAAQLPPAYAAPAPAIAQQVERWRELLGFAGPRAALQIALVGWSRAHGLTSLELYGQMGRMIGDGAALYRAETIGLLRQIGLEPTEV
jgi:AcrR family transcriptional regulator